MPDDIAVTCFGTFDASAAVEVLATVIFAALSLDAWFLLDRPVCVTGVERHLS